MTIGHVIEPLTAIAPLSRGAGADASAKAFPGFLQNALSLVNNTEAAVQHAGLSAVTGVSPDIHTVILATQKAEIALNLTLQVRNKIVEAYQEITRMQI
jgi:flagellar hook-basal body complex protein FliE